MSAKRKRKSGVCEFLERLVIALAPAMLTLLVQHFKR